MDLTDTNPPVAKWRVVRAAYFEGEKGPLITGAVAPLLRSLDSRYPEMRKAFRTHWRRGPHLDLMIECTENQFQTLFPEIRDALAAWIADHPSRTVLDEQRYLRTSRELAVRELDTGALTPLYANNSVLAAEYEPGNSSGPPALNAEREQFLSLSWKLLVGLAELKGRSSDDFFLSLATMMAQVGHTYDVDGLYRGHLSFRSHSEFFFANYDPGGKVRQSFGDLEKSFAARIDARIRGVLQGAVEDIGHPNEVALLDQWRQILEVTKPRIQAVVSQHAAQMITDEGSLAASARELAMRHQVQGEVATAEMEKIMQSATGRALRSTPQFLCFRTLVNFFYLYLPILSVAPVQKFATCYLVANACERIFGRSWRSYLEAPRPQSRGEQSA